MFAIFVAVTLKPELGYGSAVRKKMTRIRKTAKHECVTVPVAALIQKKTT
jgi:hypothetical protein